MNKEQEEQLQGETVVPIRPGVAMRGQGKNQYGLTAKQEAFAGFVANGNSLTASYKMAFAPPNSSDTTIMNKASELMRRDYVQARVNELVAQNNSVKQLDAVRMLSFVRERLLIEAQNTASKPADRLKALELIGKLSDVAAFRDRIVEETVDTKTALEMEREIKRKLEKILAA
jgi:hypothetical protein